MYGHVMPIESVEFEFGLPLGLGSLSGTWSPNRAQREAAWEMYVELITRIAVQPLGQDEGLLREALNSVYTIFGSTREILRRHGPSVATIAHGTDSSFGSVAVVVLNDVLRPFLARWHPVLLNYESGRPPDVSPTSWEDSWTLNDQARGELGEVRKTLGAYAGVLARICEIEPIH